MDLLVVFLSKKISLYIERASKRSRADVEHSGRKKTIWFSRIDRRFT